MSSESIDAPAPAERPDPALEGYFGAAWPRMVRFAELLEREGELRGLIGPRELPRLWSRHLVNSAVVADFVPPSSTVADVGSGAGFPGLVLAIMRPDADVRLIEPMERRVEWLRYVADDLALENVSISRARAEELHGAVTFDVVTARAVAAMDKLARWTLPLVAPGGRLLALKGERAPAELEAARSVLRKLGVEKAEVHEVVGPLGDRAATLVEVTTRP
ncbi:16S rRNA (guanine(527)-N(7))-methyltransferase RsmG [Georgenia faecalis]|uniref:16S rRNA (guanine(527)-N(7))-methyltransferase RsmG n=1 Tax=Georgenia faecalis TaxID=2483799 RepID=UPI001F49EB9F|nr:16S rRNA (guanine(527)-N(7))-methyltransferase RsmG [Georgenia faecalis]